MKKLKYLGTSKMSKSYQTTVPTQVRPWLVEVGESLNWFIDEETHEIIVKKAEKK